MTQLEPSITVALIAGIFGVITTWLTIKYKDRVVKKTQREDRAGGQVAARPSPW